MLKLSNISIEQSPEWAKFQESIPGRGQVWTLDFADAHGESQHALIVLQRLPMGKSWLWCPRGPVMDDYNDQTAWHNFLKEVKTIAILNKAVFLRVELPVLDTNNVAWPNGFKPAHDHYLPEHTLVVDLTTSQEKILEQMKPKGRYNIKLAQKKGVDIFKSQNVQHDVKVFYKLLTQTTQRDGFAPHSESYYAKMLEILQPKGMAELFLAEYEGKIIASLIATFYKDTATYYFGASSNEYRNVMAPYLLQWEAILEGKRRNCKHYDFLGIAPDNKNSNHPWAGITEFKRKFGGEMVAYQQAREYVFQPLWYQGMKIYKKFR